MRTSALSYNTKRTEGFESYQSQCLGVKSDEVRPGVGPEKEFLRLYSLLLRLYWSMARQVIKRIFLVEPMNVPDLQLMPIDIRCFRREHFRPRPHDPMGQSLV